MNWIEFCENYWKVVEKYNINPKQIGSILLAIATADSFSENNRKINIPRLLTATGDSYWAELIVKVGLPIQDINSVEDAVISTTIKKRLLCDSLTLLDIPNEDAKLAYKASSVVARMIKAEKTICTDNLSQEECDKILEGYLEECTKDIVKLLRDVHKLNPVMARCILNKVKNHKLNVFREIPQNDLFYRDIGKDLRYVGSDEETYNIVKREVDKYYEQRKK